jgi:WD40 repeat protein
MFSPDGKILATADEHGTVCLYSAETWKELTRISGRGDIGGLMDNVLDFSGDGSLLAIAGDEGVRLIDVATRSERNNQKISESEHGVFGVHFANRRKTLAARSEGWFVWDVAKDEVIDKGVAGGGHALVFSPDDTTLAVVWHGPIVLWDSTTKKTTNIDLKSEDEHHIGAVWLPDGNLLIGSDPKNNVARIRRISFSPGRASSAKEAAAPVKPLPTESATPKTASAETTPVNVRKLPEPLFLKGHSNTPWALAFTPDGNTLVTAGADGDVKVWEVTTGKELVGFRRSSFVIRSVAVSPDGHLVAVAGGDHAVGNQPGAVRILDSESKNQAARLEGHAGLVTCVGFSPDGKLLASGSADGAVKLWDTATWKETLALAHPSERVNYLAFTLDGSSLATACESGTIRLWDVGTGTEKAKFKGKGGAILSLAFTRDGKTLAAGHFRDRSITLWDTATGAARGHLTGHAGNIVSLAFSPDGQLLVSGSFDGTVRLWDPIAGKERSQFAHDPSWTTVAVPAEDKILIATGIKDGTVKLWRVPR